MKKIIPIGALRPGMYAWDLGVPWLDHEFLRRRFLVCTAGDVARIAATGIAELTIDTARGKDVPPAARAAASTARASPGSNEPAPAAVPQELEIARAGKLLPAALVDVQAILDGVRLGGILHMDRAESVVAMVVHSLLRHPAALISLLRIKDRDNYTYMHSLAVCALLVHFAMELGLDPDAIRETGIGGLLHDVGKMRIPVAILNKPGPLTDGENEILRTHAAIGADLLVRTSHASAIPQWMARHHHERMDGTGYPDGLQGAQISLFARMASIVDAYDAMTSDRCYRRGMPATAALAAMWAAGGTQFDQGLLQVFLRGTGIYPAGALVRLSNDHLAVVVAQNAGNLLAPRVRIVFDLRSRTRVDPRDLDLGSLPVPAAIQIVGYETPEVWGIHPEAYLR